MKVIKSKKDYQGYAQQVIEKLLKADNDLLLFFNILDDNKRRIPLISIIDDLKPLYRVTAKSIIKLNSYLKKYNIEIVTDTVIIKQTNPMIQLAEPYYPKDYKSNSKPVTIYNRKHLPMIIEV
jgi:GTPase Era involved in 16S rRNA processing